MSCSRVYLTRQRTWNRCRHPLCWPCARLRASALRAELQELAADYPAKLTMTLSLQSTPSASLCEAWDALDAVRGEFAKGRWLTSRVDAYRWHSEVTKGPNGWHPHVAFLLVSRNELTAPEFALLRESMLNRWASLAADHGLMADPEHQHLDPILRTPGRAIGYLTKGPMALHEESRTAGRIFLDAALLHDAEAVADWLEIEDANVGRRWQGTGGEFRRRAVVDPESDLSVPFSITWINSELGSKPQPKEALRIVQTLSQPVERSPHVRLTERQERAAYVRERAEQDEAYRRAAEAEARAATEREHAEHLARLAILARRPPEPARDLDALLPA